MEADHHPMVQAAVEVSVNYLALSSVFCIIIFTPEAFQVGRQH